MRLPNKRGDAQSVRLSYTPLVSVDAVRAQYARPESGDHVAGATASG